MLRQSAFSGYRTVQYGGDPFTRLRAAFLWRLCRQDRAVVANRYRRLILTFAKFRRGSGLGLSIAILPADTVEIWINENTVGRRR